MYSIDWARLRSVVSEKEAWRPNKHAQHAAVAGLQTSGPASSSSPLSGAEAQVLQDPKAVADHALAAIRTCFRVQGTFNRVEGDHLEFLLRTNAYRDLGYSSFGDFVREELQMSSRTATRRIRLSRVSRESATLSSAVDKGLLSPCQALALRPVMESNDLNEWIEKAASLNVHELNGLVQSQASEASEAFSDVDGRMVTFGAPASAAYVWEHGMELARRVLGWQAPAYRCVEAVLAEATTELCALMPVTDTHPAVSGRASKSRGGAYASGSSSKALEDAKPVLQWTEQLKTLAESVAVAEGEMSSFQKFSDAGPKEAKHSLEVLRLHKRWERCLRILFVQILQDADSAGVIAFWGYRSITHFLIEELKVSERTAGRYMSEAWAFESNPALSHAYCSGRIGLGQAYLVNRVASSSTQAAFIRRAEAVTHLQFEREVLFLEKLSQFWPTLARRFQGPLPMELLEHGLREGLRELGWSAEKIEKQFGPVIAGDPALNPTIMGNLELLLESFALALEEWDMRVRDGVSMSDGADVVSATLASNGETREHELPATLASAMLAGGRRTTTISFWAPDPLIEEWNEAINTVQRRHGPLPIWAAAIFVLQIAVQEWERVDMARRPTEWKILERDGWRCQAPGCSARSRLEVHHIVYRSRGGSDLPDNLVTLCHAHHQHGIHGKGLRLEGAAPGELRWRLGTGKDFQGSKRMYGSQETLAIS